MKAERQKAEARFRKLKTEGGIWLGGGAMGGRPARSHEVGERMGAIANVRSRRDELWRRIYEERAKLSWRCPP